jgi:hypothetical protein
VKDAYEMITKSPSFKNTRDDRMVRADQGLASLLIYTNPKNPINLNVDGKQCCISARHFSNHPMTGPLSSPWMSSNYLAAFAMSDYVTGAAKWQSNITGMLLSAKDKGYEDG